MEIENSMEGSGHDLNEGTQSLKGLRKATKNLSQDSWSLSQDLNPGPPKYKAEVLTT
jgi:archaellum component FlaC